MWLLAGLGNPGASYAAHRHNIGFMAIDRIAARYQAEAFSSKFSAQIAPVAIAGTRAWLIKPQTYMNCSGEAVGAMMRFYKIPPAQLIVFHDELDLPLGKVRVKQGGGSGGHNGIKSLDAHVGADYWRVRLGIGHPGEKDQVSPHVLSDFRKEEWPEAERMVDTAASALPLLLAGEANQFAQAFTLAK